MFPGEKRKSFSVSFKPENKTCFSPCKPTSQFNWPGLAGRISGGAYFEWVVALLSGLQNR
jgi:hypothetical protein